MSTLWLNVEENLFADSEEDESGITNDEISDDDIDDDEDDDEDDE